MPIRLTALLLFAAATPAFAAMLPTPARTASEGAGPYPRLVIRGVTVIQGDGSPPYGPADIVIEGGRIADIVSAGTPGLPLRADKVQRHATAAVYAGAVRRASLKGTAQARGCKV